MEHIFFFCMDARRMDYVVLKTCSTYEVAQIPMSTSCQAPKHKVKPILWHTQVRVAPQIIRGKVADPSQ